MAEIIGEAELIQKFDANKDVSAYLGRATTGPFHLGHVVATSKLMDLQKKWLTFIVF